MGSLQCFQQGAESSWPQYTQSSLTARTFAISSAIILGIELLISIVWIFTLRLLRNRNVTVEDYMNRFAHVAKEMKNVISQGQAKTISPTYWEGFGPKQHLIWALHHIEDLNSDWVPTENKHGGWSGIKIVKGIDPRKTLFEQYDDRMTQMCVEMRNVILQGSEDAYSARYSSSGYGPKESVMWILHNIDKLDERGQIRFSEMSGQLLGVKIAFGPDPLMHPAAQHRFRIKQLAREMKDIIREGGDEIVSQYYGKLGYSPKELLTWTLHHIHLCEDDGQISKKGRWASKKRDQNLGVFRWCPTRINKTEKQPREKVTEL